MHRIISGYGGLAVLDIRAASGQAIAFESRSAEMGKPSHRHASRVAGVSQEGSLPGHPPRHHRGATRARGPPARMLSHCVPLSSPAMRHPATLPAGRAWAQSKQNPGAVVCRAGWERWPSLCQDLCGRDARAPGWAFSLEVVASWEVHRTLRLFVVGLQQRTADSSSNDPSGTA